MKSYWKAIGITVAAAGLLYYPALKLYQYLMTKRQALAGNETDETHHVKAFSPAYRGKHKPHHRTGQNGHNHN